MDILSAFGLSASAGLNAYIPLLVVALLGKFTDLISLTSPWDTLESWWIIGVLLLLSLIEFFADKIPAVNHINDILQTVIRPIAGAIVFAASAQIITSIHPVLAMIMGLIVAGSVHAVKSIAVRPAVTATTAGTGNVPVSIAEDVISTIISIIAAVTPVLIAVLLVLSAALIVWMIWRRINHERALHKNSY
jgi:hypothetical protein